MATKNNWLQTNLNTRSLRNLSDFSIEITPYVFNKKTFEEASRGTALEIYNKYDNLYLCYSGGLDSEYVLKVFKELGLKITPIILSTPFNKLEYEYAIKYCKNNNIRYEVIEYSKRDIVYKLYEKTTKQGLYSLLGGIPLILCDYVNQVGGKLLTGYGEPFTTIPGEQPNHRISETLEFCEWDYYLDLYDSSHPSGFFTYDISIFHSLIRDIRYDTATQIAKYELYKLEPRRKIFWDKDFYKLYASLVESFKFDHQYFIHKSELFNTFNNYVR